MRKPREIIDQLVFDTPKGQDITRISEFNEDLNEILGILEFNRYGHSYSLFLLREASAKLQGLPSVLEDGRIKTTEGNFVDALDAEGAYHDCEVH